ncbi:MAG TPA: hypothetical protein VHZ73_08450 [Vicinamibacterales bacterium]|jgi:hypothetical protein|nr:hypothetical protein [Vicinamibacterales bacterium]
MTRRPHRFVPTAAQLRIAELAAVSPDGARIEFRIQRCLTGANVYMRMHWRKKRDEIDAWRVHLTGALITAVGAREAQRLLGPGSGLPGAKANCCIRRRVEVIRKAPRRGGLLTDVDNLRFAVKPLHDALVHIGLLHDDSEAWIDAPSPTQELSHDKTWWTWIAITDVEVPHA